MGSSRSFPERSESAVGFLRLEFQRGSESWRQAGSVFRVLDPVVSVLLFVDLLGIFRRWRRVTARGPFSPLVLSRFVSRSIVSPMLEWCLKVSFLAVAWCLVTVVGFFFGSREAAVPYRRFMLRSPSIVCWLVS